MSAKLRRAGVPIVAGTDGYGMELVRELELYVDGGLTPAEALATATIAPARNVKADNRTGSIAVGKEADLLLVDGDPSQRIWRPAPRRQGHERRSPDGWRRASDGSGLQRAAEVTACESSRT